MMSDAFSQYLPTPDSLGTVGDIVTPGNIDLPGSAKSVVCLTAGNITIVPLRNSDAVTLSFVGVSAGFVPPYRVRRVTAATAIVATIED